MIAEASPLESEGRVLDVQGTRILQLVLDFLLDRGDFAPGGKHEPKRILVLQGGTRSSKTFSTLQGIAVASFDPRVQAERWRFSIVRKALATLRGSAMKEFFEEVLDPMGLYDERHHNKTECTYELGEAEAEFFGADQSQKLRGRKRHVLYANEANELSAEDKKQLFLRTSRKIILDYNPSDPVEWIEEVLRRADCHLDVSTYLDNPYLDEEIVKEVEQLVPVYEEADGTLVYDWELEYDGDGLLVSGDVNAWRVYGRGEPGKSEATIYTSWGLTDAVPPDVDDECYGLDFGWNAPSALVHCATKDVVGSKPLLYWDELLYERKLTDEDLIGRLEELIPEEKRALPIYCDSAEPERIQALCNAGFNAHDSDKSVSDGIRSVQGRRLLITKRSANLSSEARRYKWRVHKDGRILDEPVKAFDHALDAGRYATHTGFGKPPAFEVLDI